MELLRKIRALFKFKGEVQELYLSSAEIKKDKVFLHPIDDPLHTICITAKSTEILIDPEDEVLEENIKILDTPKNKSPESEKKTPKDKSNGREDHYLNTVPGYITQKKRISILLYPEEYDMIMNHIKSHGYKKTEYFLACTKAARQTSVESAYRYYTKFHKQKKEEDLQRAKEAYQNSVRERQAEKSEGQKDETNVL